MNAIGPGAIETPINTSAWDTPEALAKLLTLIPYGRAGVADDIGKVAVFLASDQSDYMTGQTTLRRWRHDALSGLRDGGASGREARPP